MSSVNTDRQGESSRELDGAEDSWLAGRRLTRWPSWRLPATTLLIGLVVTGGFAWISHAQYVSNEHRLLKLRARDAGALLTEAVPGIQTSLASAAEVADATNGDVRKFKRFIAPYVGAGPSHTFASVSLWKLAAPARGPVAVVGIEPKLANLHSQASAFFKRAARTPSVAVIGLLGAPSSRLGYEFNDPRLPGGFAVYGESPLPADRDSPIQRSSQFADLDYAVYLGSRQQPRNLLLTSQARLPLPGDTYAETLPFGDTTLTLVMASRGSLLGSLPRLLPWLVAILGVLLSGAAAASALMLTRRRRAAELLAARLEVSANETRQLYSEQRNIAQTLQHALLPDKLPRIAGVQVSAWYEPGEHGVDIGGDWYDVLDLDGGRLLLVVGDVSGRGLRAATTMAALRYAIHAYAPLDDAPSTILNRLSGLLSVADSGHMATVLCVLVDTGSREITVASAGHLPPLLISNGESRYLEAPVGLPIGIESGSSYPSTVFSAPESAVLLAFTDGLVERRGESLDDGLSRLNNAVTHHNLALPELLNQLVAEVRPGPSEDDMAIIGLRWTGREDLDQSIDSLRSHPVPAL